MTNQLTRGNQTLVWHSIHSIDVRAIGIRRPDAHHTKAQHTMMRAPLHIAHVSCGVQATSLRIPAPGLYLKYGEMEYNLLAQTIYPTV